MAAGCAGNVNPDHSPATESVQMQALPLSGQTLTGDQFELASLRGQLVVIDFWASWCEPCRRELPELSNLARRYAGTVTFVGINEDDALEDANAFLSTQTLAFETIHDADKSIAEAWKPAKMPTLFVVDQNGTVVEVIAGEVPTLIQDLENVIKQHAGSPAS